MTRLLGCAVFGVTFAAVILTVCPFAAVYFFDIDTDLFEET